MDALVLVVRPARRTTYAVVYGDRTYDADYWNLLTVEEAAMRLPAEDEHQTMMRRLRDYVEIEALYRDVDAIVVERELLPQSGRRLCGAVLQAGFAARKPGYVADPDAWRRVPCGETMNVLPFGLRAQADKPVGETAALDLALRKTIRLGLYASRQMGIVPLAAMPDGDY